MPATGKERTGPPVGSLQSRRGYFAVCRIIGYAIGAQLEVAASLEIAQVVGENISKPRHWRDVETVSQVAEDHCARAVIGGDEIGRGKENGHEIRLGGG